MLERKIVPQEAKIGNIFFYGPAAGAKKGQAVVLSGWFTDSGGPTGKAGKPGYATVSSARVCYPVGSDIILSTGLGVTSALPILLVDKLNFRVDESDLTLDVIYSGEQCIGYTHGFFETDQYYAFGGDVALGTKMYVATGAAIGSGLIATGTAAAVTSPQSRAVAIYWGRKSHTYDTNVWAQAPIYIQWIGGTNVQ